MTEHGTVPTHRNAALGAIGGVLWALSPVAWAIADIRTLEPGTATFAAIWGTYAAGMVLGPALVAVGHTALPRTLGGRAARLGAAIGGLGLAAVAVGNAIELVSLAAGSGTSVVGYVVFYLGFLVAFVGSLLVGTALLRRRVRGAPRVAGWLLALALPLGMAVALLANLVLPDHEAGFSAAVSVPTGVAWALLGRALARGRAPASAQAPSPVAA